MAQMFELRLRDSNTICKIIESRSSLCGSAEKNLTSIHEEVGSIPGFTGSCGVGRRHCSYPVLLRLWHRLAATVSTGPLAWELPYAAGSALKSKNKRKKEN